MLFTVMLHQAEDGASLPFQAAEGSQEDVPIFYERLSYGVTKI